MKKILYSFMIVMGCAFICGMIACGNDAEEAAPAREKAAPEITQEELTAAVPALSDVHEIVYPLWHTAYPEKDYALIKELLPQADALVAALDEAELPGILRDKQTAWDEGKNALKESLRLLHEAADSDNQEEMLSQTEVFHSAYEKLVRTIRPLVSELEAFHQDLYKLYHYYAPDYVLENIRTTVAAMQAKIPALREVQLPQRLAEKQGDFEAAVRVLADAVDALAEAVQTDDKEKILAEVDNVHGAYQNTEKIFD